MCCHELDNARKDLEYGTCKSDKKASYPIGLEKMWADKWKY